MPAVLEELVWRPEILNAKIAAAFRSSGFEAKKLMESIPRWAGVRSSGVAMFTSKGSSGNVIILKARSPLAHLEAGGAKAHEVGPGAVAMSRTSRSRRRSQSTGLFETVTRTSTRKKRGGAQAIKFTKGDGGFARGSFTVPGFAGDDYPRAVEAAWPAIFRRSATLALARAL